MLKNLATAMVVMVALTPVKGAAQAAETVPQISIVGQGQISVVPDVAQINIGVVQSADTAASALAGMRDDMNAVFAQLSRAGVDPADMRTGTMQLNREYESGLSQSGQSASGFVAQTSVQVFVRDLSVLGDVLDASVQDGANTLNGLQFDVAEPAPYILAARQAAVADARAAAEVYAQAAGVILGPVISIRETHSGGGGIVMMEARSASTSGVPVAAGEIEISRAVEIVYELLPE